MQPIEVNKETIILGTKRHRLDWVLRPMQKGIPGDDNYEVLHNLVFHVYDITDPAFPDRVRMAWKRSGLDQKVAVEILPPIELEGEAGTFKTEAWDVILENIDPCYADAVRKTFITALIQVSAVAEPPPDAEVEVEEEAEEEGFDPHGIGLEKAP
jgi:hypothetical protein